MNDLSMNDVAAIPPAEKAIVEKLPDERIKEITIELSEPIQAHGEQLKKMTFRKPTGDDLMAMGRDLPINIDWPTGKVTVAPECMGRMMSRLAGVPPSSIKSMAAADFSTAAHALMGFFTPGGQAISY